MKKMENTIKVKWKDTNKYPFSIEYTYPLAIRNRCLFFWSTTIKGWRTIINLANKLTEPNRICIVYIFGEAKKEIILKHIQKLNNQRLIVLWADYITIDEIEIIMNGAERIRNAVLNWGIGDKSNFDERNPYSEKDIEEKIHKFCFVFPSDIYEGRKLLNSVQQKIFENGYKNISENMKNVRAEENQHIMDLFKIIKKIYLYGVEGDTTLEYAYKILHFEKWCNNGIEGKTLDLRKLGVHYDDYSQPVQLSLFDNTSWGIVEFVKEFRNICDTEMEKNGFVDLRMVFHYMQDIPYGMYHCNYYGLCIGISLQKYKHGYYISGNLKTSKSENIDFPISIKYIMESFNVKRQMPFYIYTQSEKQVHLADNILKIFKPKRNIGVVCLENVLTIARSWIRDNVMYDTVQRTIPELFEILNLWEPCVCSNITEKYSECLTDERVEQIKIDICNIDKKFLSMLSDRFGEEKAGLYKKSQYVKGGAVGWLHSTDMVDERVEWYMKQTVCRECGIVINDIGYEVYENGISGKHARLSKQNIINLNKKILGRYQNEYFCVRCLCEYLEITEWELYEKMKTFKEQGCELF